MAFVPIYIRFLGSESYGLIGFFTTASILMHTIAMGIEPTLTREMTRLDDGSGRDSSVLNLKVTIEILATITAIGIFAMVYIFSKPIAEGWLKPKTIDIVTVVYATQLMGLIISIRLVEAVYRSSLIGLGKISSFAIIHSVTATVRGVGGVFVLKYTQGDVLAFFIWNLATTLLNVALLKTQVERSLKKVRAVGVFSIRAVSDVKTFALGMVVVYLTGSLFTQLDKFLLSGLMPLDEYGGFIIAANLAAVVFMAVSPLAQAIFPDLSRAHLKGDAEEFQQIYIWSVKLVVIMLTSIAFSLALNASEVLGIWVGDVDLIASIKNVFVILCFVSIFNGLSWIPQQAKFALKETRSTIKINIYLSLFLIFSLPLAYYLFGIEGCVMIVLAANLIFAAYYLLNSKEYLTKISFRKFLLEAIFFPSLISLLLVFCFRRVFLRLDAPILLELSISGIVVLILLLRTFNYFSVNGFNFSLNNWKNI